MFQMSRLARFVILFAWILTIVVDDVAFVVVVLHISFSCCVHERIFIMDNEVMEGKKRQRKEENYARNKVKRSRVKGTAYTSYAGKAVPQKSIGPPCRYGRNNRFYLNIMSNHFTSIK